MTDLQQRLKSVSVLVVGDVMLDRYWFGDVNRISPEAPVPIVHVTREEYRLGGAANVALNVASLGAGAGLMSVVGEDEPARLLGDLLDRARIKAMTHVEPGLSTTLKLRVSGRSQQLLRIDFERQPAAQTVSAMTDDFKAIAPDYDAIIMSDYGKGGLREVSAKIAHARALGIPVFVDPKGSDYAPYRGATVITPNRGELAQVIGAWRDEAELTERAMRLREELELDAMLLTRSEDGMSLFDAEGELRVHAQAREVFDVTGAGDTSIAVLATMVAAGATLREAVPLANRAGSLVVERFGTAAVSAEELFAPEAA